MDFRICVYQRMVRQYTDIFLFLESACCFDGPNAHAVFSMKNEINDFLCAFVSKFHYSIKSDLIVEKKKKRSSISLSK